MTPMLDIVSDDHDVLLYTLSILLKEHTIVAFSHKDNKLHLHWHYEPDKMFPLLAPTNDPASLAAHLSLWLKRIDYPREPDTDGSVEKGWYINNGGYSGWDYVAFTIEPEWVVYGK